MAGDHPAPTRIVQAATGWPQLAGGSATPINSWRLLGMRFPMVDNAKLSPWPKNRSNILETIFGKNRKQHQIWAGTGAEHGYFDAGIDMVPGVEDGALAVLILRAWLGGPESPCDGAEIKGRVRWVQETGGVESRRSATRNCRGSKPPQGPAGDKIGPTAGCRRLPGNP